jgi:putative nucleotidyltransferase with HDIG domain
MYSSFGDRQDAGQNQELLSFAEIISALSFAVDLTEGAVPGHAIRCCILGMRIGRELHLPETQIASMYYALLLKDSGCSSNAARMCQIVGGDDRAIKNGAKLEDWTKPHKPSLRLLKLLWREALPGANSLRKILRIVQIGLTQHKNNAEVIALRCDRGAQIARKLGLSAETSEAVRCLDEHWDGSGYPDHLRGAQIPIIARILAVAQHLDVFASECSTQEATKILAERSGKWFDPKLVKLVQKLERQGRLWTDCLPTGDPEAARRLVVSLEPNPGHGIRASVDSTRIDEICEAFADVVDAKSPFTYRHSMGVAEAAREIAETLELPEDRRRLIWRAALLHDLGKLAVPNTILDKPAKLTPEEFAVVAEHPRLSREILKRIHSFAEMAEIAGCHHEKLDGSGYPDKRIATDLCLEARLIAVADFYQALVEDRPYRAGMTHERAMSILRGEAIDQQCVDALEYARKIKSGEASALRLVETAPLVPPMAWVQDEITL